MQVMGEWINTDDFGSRLVSGKLRGAWAAERAVRLSVIGIDPSSGETQLAQAWPSCRDVSGFCSSGDCLSAEWSCRRVENQSVLSSANNRN